MPDDHLMWILVFWSCDSVMVALFERVIMKRLRLGANIFENSNAHAITMKRTPKHKNWSISYKDIGIICSEGDVLPTILEM